MWQLDKVDKTKFYTNTATGSKCQLAEVHIDKEGNKWYMFTDLAAIPYLRSFAANKVTSLYTLGLSKIDLDNHIASLKKFLKSNDPDKYEKAYAQVLDFETKAANATDSIKQMTALVCVYFTLNDEPIDSFVQETQLKKMQLLEADPAMHSFFLKMQTEAIEDYTTSLNNLLQTVSSLQKEISVPLEMKSSEPQTQTGT